MPAPGALIEIVLTGGPGAGKTTALARLSAKLNDWGYRVLLAPEVATLLITGGVADIGLIAAEPARFFELETQFLRFQRALRERYRDLAAALGEPTVIIYDRAECDVAAYIGAEAFAAMLERERLTMADVRDNHDAVIHLVTPAIGALEAYTTANNAARRETPEEAAALDRRTLAAWQGHPKLRIIGNETDFDTKIRRTVAAVARVVGIPEPLEIERKFRLAAWPSPEALASLHATPIEIEQIYLRSDDPDVEVRIRRRGAVGAATYYRTEKRRLSATTRHEVERIISAAEYHHLRREADPARAIIRKTRYCFTHGETYVELDLFDTPAGLALAEIELVSEDDVVGLPASLGAYDEVTDDPAYSNAALAVGA